MKLLLPAYCSNEYMDCQHFLVSLDSEEIALLRARRDRCVAFLNELDPGGYGGHVEFPFFGAEAGNFSFKDIPDGHYEAELQQQRWALIAEDTEFEDREYIRIECTGICVFRDGDVHVTTLFKHYGGNADSQLLPEALDEICRQPNPA